MATFNQTYYPMVKIEDALRIDPNVTSQQMTEFLKRVEAARQSPTPGWVKGPRPSDECLAVHNDDDHPLNEENCGFDLQETLQVRDHEALMFMPVPTLFQLQKVDARGVSCFWANWPGIDAGCGVVLFLHGGAMMTGHPLVDWCPHLSRTTGKAVLTVDYRMAPEYPMPTATEDVVSAYRWLLEDEKVPPGKIAIYGGSSGGTLVVLALQDIVSQSLPLPACGVPVSAWAPHPTQEPHWEVVVGNRDANGQSTGKDNNKFDTKYNIFAANYRGMPPLYVMVGGEENVYRDLNASKRLADVAREAGVEVVLDIVAHLQHCPDQLGLPHVPEATQAVARAAKFIDDMMARATRP